MEGMCMGEVVVERIEKMRGGRMRLDRVNSFFYFCNNNQVNIQISA